MKRSELVAPVAFTCDLSALPAGENLSFWKR